MPTGEAASTVCAGCDRRIPGDVGTVPHADGTCYGEWLKTPLGLTYVRTCWARSCVLDARRRRDGKRTTPPQPRDAVDTAALR